MPDSPVSNGNAIMQPARTPFPLARMFYAFGFGIIAWFVIHVIFVLALVQFVMLAVTGRQNGDIKAANFSLVQYLWELLAYITFVRDERPFPVGHFPTPN